MEIEIILTWLGLVGSHITAVVAFVGEHLTVAAAFRHFPDSRLSRASAARAWPCIVTQKNAVHAQG